MLTDKTLNEAIKSNQYLSIIFYAPWCPHCKQFIPEIEKATKDEEFKKMGVKFGKLNLDFYKNIAQDLNIHGFPTIYFYKNGEKISYTGGRSKNDLVEWFRKRLVNPIHEVNSLKTIKDEYENQKVNKLIYFGTDKAKIEQYKQIALEEDEHIFGLCTNKEIIENYGPIKENFKQETERDNIVFLFKNYDEPTYDFTKNITSENIKEMININSKPLLELNFENTVIFNLRIQKNLVLFIGPEKYDSNKNIYKNDLKKVAQKYRGKITFTYGDKEDEIAKKVLNISEINDTNLKERNIENEPIVIIFAFSRRFIKWKLYEHYDNYNAANFDDFVGKFLDGKFKPEPMSEDIPSDEENDKKDVYKLVNKSFRKIVIENKRTTLVKFYSPSCPHCKKLAPVYEELGKFYKNKKQVLIAEFDMTKNDFDLVEIRGFPTIILFKNGDEKNYQIYDGNRTFDDLNNFIGKNINN